MLYSYIIIILKVQKEYSNIWSTAITEYSNTKITIRCSPDYHKMYLYASYALLNTKSKLLAYV